MVLHLAADQVHLDRAVDEPGRTIGRALQYAMPAVTVTGVVGSNTTAAASRGAELVDRLVEAFAALLAQIRAERDPQL